MSILTAFGWTSLFHEKVLYFGFGFECAFHSYCYLHYLIRQCEKVKNINYLCCIFVCLIVVNFKVCCFALRNVIINYNASSGFAISNKLNFTLLQYFLKQLVIKGTNSQRELNSWAKVRVRVLERGGSFFCRANYFLSLTLCARFLLLFENSSTCTMF